MDERLEQALRLVERVHDRGGSAADAIQDVLGRFSDTSLAARAARSRYRAQEIGRALLELFPDPDFDLPYYYSDCCCWS